MSVTVKHPFVSTVPDSTDTSLVRPSNWNADHTIVGLGTAAELNAGVANGVASLDSAGTVPISQLPAAVLGALSYQGTWDASTNTPTLASSTGTKGYYYVVSVAGSTNLNGITDWKVGDWAVFNGSVWQKIDNTDAVTSVNGYTGAVVLTAADISGAANAPTNTNITSMTGVTGAIDQPTLVHFNTTYATALTEGQLGWDGNNTLGLGMAGGNVVQHIGEDSFIYTKASSAITKGQVVMFTGAVGASAVPTGAPATGVADGSYIMGVAAESIATNGFGLVQTFGTLRNVNTSTYADGEILWYNPAVTGGLTATKPSAPNVKVQLATVLNGGSSGGGSILIRVNAGSTLGGTDQNVQIGTPTSGNTLIYDATAGYWKNANISAGTGVSITNGAGAITVANIGVTSFSAGTTGLTPATGTNGAVTLAGTLAIANGGTGATTAATARTALGLGTIATQNANAVAITGGAVDGTTVGSTTTAAGSFTTLNSSGATRLGGLSGNQSLQVNNVASAVNYAQIVGAVTNGAPLLSVQGTDANISLPIISKGTGAIDLVAGSSGVNISNGGTVTAITRTAGGSGYTTTPSVVISAPTTAGGVQATASTNYNLFGIGLASGGTGYTVSDVLTIVGGTFTDQLQLTVTAVSAGVITTVSVLTGSFGIYSALPPSTPATVTGGTGTGATFNLTWSLRGITVATAGSGYVEQPTINITGGGGSGAAAYATIGSGTAIKSLGTTMSLSASAGEVLRLSDNGGTSTNFLLGLSGISGVQPQLRSTGETNTNLLLGSNGAGAIRFTTLGGTAVEQVRVSHTASAVNYLNLTGAATTATPTISAAGSDSNISVKFTPKGTGGLWFTGPLLPNNLAGTSGQVLTSAGAGAVPTWTTPAGSNITAQGLYENSATISANYTIGTGNNAVSAGPITINSGVVVTVPSGSTWVIV